MSTFACGTVSTFACGTVSTFACGEPRGTLTRLAGADRGEAEVGLVGQRVAGVERPLVDGGSAIAAQTRLWERCQLVRKIDRRGVRGAPDWVLEVLSPSTAAHDQIAKRRTYERAGVREYWLVHPGDRTLTVYLLDNGQYGRPEIYELKDATPIGVLPGVSIAWDALVARLPKPEY